MPALSVPPAKVCTRCRVERPLDEFPRDRHAPLGHHPWCYECKRAVARERERLVSLGLVDEGAYRYNARRAHRVWIEKGAPGRWAPVCCRRCGAPAGDVLLIRTDTLLIKRPDILGLSDSPVPYGHALYICAWCLVLARRRRKPIPTSGTRDGGDVMAAR